MTDSSLRLLLDFDRCVKKDQGQAQLFLHRRDRKFAITSKEQSQEPTPQRWLEHINKFSGQGAPKNPSSSIIQFWQRVNKSFAGIGIVLGSLGMAGLLFYDGGQRINVTLVMAFVAFQLLMAILTTVQSLVGWQPWAALVNRFNKQEKTDTLNKLQPLLMAKAAHLGGVCFALAGIVTLLLMVLLQDLAFGWSTTIETDSTSYHSLVNLVAIPWAWLWPAAVPELGLVEATRFFRASNLANAATTVTNPTVWGQWWPFIAMLWTTWALVPRLLLFILSGVLIRHKAQSLLKSHTGMTALLYRMQTPTLDTGNEHNDASDLPNTDTHLALKPMPPATILLSWAGASEIELPEGIMKDKILVEKIGGRISLSDEQSTLNTVATELAQDSKPNVLILTRSWEPPTGELEDFIERAHELFPKDTKIVLVPLATKPTDAPNQQQIQQWLRFSERMPTNFVNVSCVEAPNNNQTHAADVHK
jgi:hypothetical protein